MSQSVKGRADYYAPGDWNAQCYECGCKFKASQLLLHWQGYYVCPKHWEPRQTQDFVRGIPDNMNTSWAQPFPEATFVPVYGPNERSAVVGFGVVGVCIVGVIWGGFDPHVYPNSTEDDF